MNPFFQTFAPPKALQAYVKQYLYVVKDFEIGNTIPIIPTGLPALLLFLDPENVGYVKYYQPFQKIINLNEFYLCGQTTESYWLELSSNFSLLIIILNPPALNHLVGQSASVITNGIIPVKELGLDSNLVVEQLLASQNIQQQLPVLDAFLFKLFESTHTKTDEVNNAINLILSSNGQVSLKEIYKRERVSARTLQRKFIERIGVTPKAYLRLIRFRSMMQFISTHPQVSWLDLTYQFGYYDQSHLIKDFKQYTGQCPQSFIQTDQEIDQAILNIL